MCKRITITTKCNNLMFLYLYLTNQLYDSVQYWVLDYETFFYYKDFFYY